jgi:GNAT superfamily N-acetyltransferase
VFDFSSPYRDPGFDTWKEQLDSLPPSGVSVREAEPTIDDGNWMRWIQADCESTFIHGADENVSKIKKQLVLVAEIEGHPVGFCLALVGRTDSLPLFIQLVAVVPSARRRGAGLAMLSAAAGREPRRNIAMATLDDNTAAHNLNEHFSKSIGGKIHRVPVRTFWRTELGFAEGEKHRPWLIERP